MTIDEQFRIATEERIARYVVGIAVEKNAGIGTGTLVLVGGQRYILTAEHVIGESKQDDIRFWLRPPAAIRQKAAADAEISEIGEGTFGDRLPIVEIWKDKTIDIAAMRLDSSWVPPEAVEVYDVRKSLEFMRWDDAKLDGLSLVLFGFPEGNSKELFTEGNRSFRFLGCASYLTEYSVELNKTAWSNFSSERSPAKEFVFKYHSILSDIEPHGFSGGAVWVLGDNPNRKIWQPDPILIGGVHHYMRRSGVLVAAKLPTFIAAELMPAVGSGKVDSGSPVSSETD
jgi:hypothetical protein